MRPGNGPDRGFTEEFLSDILPIAPRKVNAGAKAKKIQKKVKKLLTSKSGCGRLTNAPLKTACAP
jgi:hypothetical protein